MGRVPLHACIKSKGSYFDFSTLSMVHFNPSHDLFSYVIIFGQQWSQMDYISNETKSTKSLQNTHNKLSIKKYKVNMNEERPFCIDILIIKLIKC